MFFSKIWFFLVALAAAVALTIALVMPRPAARAVVAEERHRLVVACGVVDILLGDDARNRVDLASAFARTPEIVAALGAAGRVDRIDEARMKQVRATGESVMKTIQGSRKPDFAILIDRRGRVVSRITLDENEFGDIAAGRPLVDDALAGYLRDDIWAHNGTMYFVSAAPVIKRDAPVTYEGAIVLGHSVTNALAQRLVQSLDVDVGFYLGKDDVAGSKSIPVDTSKLLALTKSLAGGDPARDCQANKPLEVTAGQEEYTALVSRLPGEAGQRDAFYAVFIKRPPARGFAGTLAIVNQGDLSFASFPWLFVGGGFLLILGVGIALMFFEADRPLRRLTADAVRLAKGDSERLGEDTHPGKFGSIARSVNIHIDKLGREAKSAKKDLDQLLGPAPEGSLGTIDLLATSLPPARPGGPATPPSAPPPSELKLSTAASAPAFPPGPPTRPTPPPRPAAPPPPLRPAAPAAPVAAPAAPPPPATPSPVAAEPSLATSLGDALGEALDDDILGLGRTEAAPSDGDGLEPYFQDVYEQFVATKQSCGEPTGSLTYAKFAEKLVKNREDLIARTGCKDVRFTVYVKEGKAALKATPVKDEG